MQRPASCIFHVKYAGQVLLFKSLFCCRVNHKKAAPLKQAATALLKFVKDEIISIENCEECFLNAYEHGAVAVFVMPCQSPHPLVWAQMHGFPFWPSKAMWVREASSQRSIFRRPHNINIIYSELLDVFERSSHYKS